MEELNMKASKILAGLSAVSLAASMLSMVAASADEEKLTADFTDDVVTETEKVADADMMLGGQYNWAARFGGYKWFNPFIPANANAGFVGWPGWGVAEFPTYWEWATGIKNSKDITWETYGTSDYVDKAAPGYLVFEFENGKKWLVPAAADKNGELKTEEVYIPYTNVNKIYFIYEVSENPYFQLSLEKFTVNGTEVQINKDNWKDEVKYVNTTADGKFFLMDATNNSLNAYEKEAIKAAVKAALEDAKNDQTVRQALRDEFSKFDYIIDIPDMPEEITNEKIASILADLDAWNEGNIVDFEIDLIKNYGFDTYASLNGITATEEGQLVISVNAVEEESPMYYQATLFEKGNDKSVINHGLILWNTKVQATINVSNIGVKDRIHDKTGRNFYNDKGDNKGDIHTHVDPNEAGGAGVQTQNVDKLPVNPKFFPSDTCSADLYDALVDVYNSDPEHKEDAEIRFKTVADKGGVLVANFINVWELDEVLNKDGSTTQKSWLINFGEQIVRDGSGNQDGIKIDGTAVYVKKSKIPVGFKKETKKVYKLRDGKPFKAENKNADGTITYGDYVTEDKEILMDGKTVYYPVNDTGEPKPVTAEKKVDEEEHWVFDSEFYYDKVTNTYRPDPRYGKPVHENGVDALEKLTSGDYADTYHDLKFLNDDKTEDAYCWHPYFITENGLVDVITKNYMGNNKTNVPAYNTLTDEEIKFLKDHNGMYYNDDINHAAYGHFVVFGDNTEREYSYRIKAEAVKAILDSVQRSFAQREAYLLRHGSQNIEMWQDGSDSVKFGPNNELIVDGDHPDGFTKDYESRHWLDSQVATDPNGANKDTRYAHARATHGSVWLQCCEGTYIRDVRVHPYTNLTKDDDVAKVLYGKENYAALYPTKPAESAASSAAASSAAAAQPEAAAAATDGNAESGAAAGFGIAGLLLAGAAMVCAKKKEH